MLVAIQRNTGYNPNLSGHNGVRGVRGLRDIAVLPPPTYIGYANSYATAAQYGDADNRRSWATFANTPFTDYAKVGTLNVFQFGTSDWWFILSSSGALNNANATWVRYTGTATPIPPLGTMVGGSGTQTFSEYFSGSGGAAGGGNASTGGGYGGTVDGGQPCAVPCPTNCREEITQETRYLNSQQIAEDDVAVNVRVPKIICPPRDGGVTLPCADELAALKTQLGVQGVRGGVRGVGSVNGCSTCGTASKFSRRM
jgi:hypothetical protein